MNKNNGMVVCPEPLAAEVGAQVLRDGGNAFDAALACAFMEMAVNPIQCGLGGWGGGLVYDAKSKRTEHLGFWARIGSRMSPDMWLRDLKGYTDMWHFALFDDHRAIMGHTSCMTPGTVAGFAELHAKYCTKPWGALLQPAIDVCREGFPLPHYIAMYLEGAFLPGLPTFPEILARTPGSKALWYRDDRLLAQGDRYANPDMADVLERLVQVGPGDFYSGELAERIAGEFEKHGGFVTKDDLADYRVDTEDPIRGSYRGHEFATSVLPGGGILLRQMLGILERFDLAPLEHNGPEHARLLAGALAWGAKTRFERLADPKFTDVPLDPLLSDAYIEEMAEKTAAGEMPEQSGELKPGGTTHLCTVDAEGNCATLTHTLTMYSGVIMPGLGFSWNNCVSLMDPEPGRNNSYNPGRARASALAPTILFKNGKPWIILGAAGGWTITSAVLQAIVNIVDFGMSPVEALAAPRFHSEGAPVFCESRVPRRTTDTLESRGIRVERSLSAYHCTFGRPQVIMVEDGFIAGASDPRGDGGTAIRE